MYAAVREAQRQCNQWLTANSEHINVQVPVQLQTAATVSVIDITEGITETSTFTITVLFARLSPLGA